MKQKIKVLHVTSVDITVEKFLIPFLSRLKADNYEVHIACSEGRYTPAIKGRGFITHEIPFERPISPVSNLVTLFRLYRLMRKERFHVVHVHTPVASVLGRIAAWTARIPVIIYTVHGFYFHEKMSRYVRQALIWLERILCHIPDKVFTVSQEDAITAVTEKVCPEHKVLWISNGVNTGNFSPELNSNGTREKYGISDNNRVVGFMGRFVREKGIIDLLEAMKRVVHTVPDVKLVIIGGKEDSDRDEQTEREIKRITDQDGLSSRIVFTGFIDNVPEVLNALELFVLPSYREGMPISILEAMASGKPVIATNIRGCREEVISGKTGLLVPVNNSEVLADAIIRLLSDTATAQQMGNEGRKRACEFFDEQYTIEKQLNAYEQKIREKFVPEVFMNHSSIDKPFQLFLKRMMDISASFACLALLSIPFLVTAALIRIESSGPAFFRQDRVGKNGKMFRIWKFRTMIENAVEHELGRAITDNDVRITRIGKILRNWGLDELPQLINVLQGDMSIVGPRPTLSYQVEQYDDFQRQRLLFKPGITCLSIIKGRNALSWSQRIKYDVFYVRHWSLLLDIGIILKTFWVILVTKVGIYGKDGANEDFVPSHYSQTDQVTNTETTS